LHLDTFDKMEPHIRSESHVTVTTLRPESQEDMRPTTPEPDPIMAFEMAPPMATSISQPDLSADLESVTPGLTPKNTYFNSLPHSVSSQAPTYSDGGTYPRPKKDAKNDSLGRNSAKWAATLTRAPAPIQSVARPAVRRMYVDEPKLFWTRVVLIALLALAAAAIIGLSIYQWVTAPPLIKSSYVTEMVYPPQVIACFDKVYYNLDAVPVMPMVMLGYANMSMLDYNDISIAPAYLGQDFGLTQIGNDEFSADEYKCWKIRLAGTFNGERIRFSATGITFIDVSIEATVPASSASFKTMPIMNPIKIAMTEDVPFVEAAVFRAIAADKMTPIVYEEVRRTVRGGRQNVDYVPKPTYNQQDAPPETKTVNGEVVVVRKSFVWFCLDNMHNSPDPNLFNIPVFTEVPSYDILNFYAVLGATMTWGFILYRILFGSLRMDPFGVIQRYFMRKPLREHVDDVYGGFVAIPPATPDAEQVALGLEERMARLEKMTRVLADLYLETDMVVDDPSAYTAAQARESQRMATSKDEVALAME
jgi:hypothetical protein